MFTLTSLNQTTTSRKQRVGRGNGSNRGKNAGKGNKGQTKRGHVRIGFEGGRRSLIRQVPKSRGFKAGQYTDNQRSLAVLTLSSLNSLNENTEVNFVSLLEAGLITAKIKKIRVINTGNLSKKLTFLNDEKIYLTKGVKKVLNL